MNAKKLSRVSFIMRSSYRAKEEKGVLTHCRSAAGRNRGFIGQKMQMLATLVIPRIHWPAR